MKKRILLTAASGAVGFATLTGLLKHTDKYEITVFDIAGKHSRKKLKRFSKVVRFFRMMKGSVPIKAKRENNRELMARFLIRNFCKALPDFRNRK